MSLRRVAAAAAVSLFALAAPPAMADEGMWTFDNFPADKMRAAHGWAPDQAWLDRVQASAARINGCSASFVSASGLLLTNHHCIESCLQQLSSADNDLVARGFNAAALADERRCPGQQAEVVEVISDVTARMMTAIGTNTGAALVIARDAEIARIQKEACTDAVRQRCQVVTLYGGGQYVLHRYRRYSDVRLVWAPEFQAAFFGGDPDNFNYPRYAMDAAFLRAYDGDAPAATPVHLRWNPRGPEVGEITLVAGNPGSTQRQLTDRQRAFQREQRLPLNLIIASELRGRLLAASADDPEKRRQAGNQLFGLENSFKAQFGQMDALNNSRFRAMLDANDDAFRARLAALPDAPQIGDPWGEIAEADARLRRIHLEQRFVDTGAGGSSSWYRWARLLVRAAAERDKPAGARLPGFSDADLARIGATIANDVPTYPWLEELNLGFWLEKTREYLTADSPDVRLLLGRESPDGLARALVAGSRLADPAVRKALWDGGSAAIAASDDALIRFAAAHDDRARAIRAQVQAEVTAPTLAAQARLANARFAVFGKDSYPDATFTLRLSYGTVAGWNERGRDIAPTTRLGGTWDRATGNYPFNLAQAFIDRAEQINKYAVYNFVTTNDIIGGNSGSPVIARDGSVIGAAFDGNIHSLGGNFGYDGELNRTVVVSSMAVHEALMNIYPAPRLVRELTGGAMQR